MHRPRPPSGPPPRRGVLLLVVLSMLTLFLMLGAAYIVTATRAKEAARAHARLTFGGDEARVPHARIADMVLLKVLRGGTTSLPTSPAPSAFVFESLLADKYGLETMSGTMAVSGGAPILSGTIVLRSPFNSVRSVDLNGRLLTFVTPGRPVTTHRIVRADFVGGQMNSNATTSRFNLSITVPWQPRTLARPLGGRVFINGREFAGVPAASGTVPPSNEGWDGFDFHNPFLAQVDPGTTIANSTVSRISFHPGLVGAALSGTLQSSSNSIPNGADNDNDGVLDGLFLDFGIPDVTDAHGNVVNIRASVLVVDLDGRFNVNAHDGLARFIYTPANTTTGSYTNWTTAVDIGSTPLGSGYGPAEVDGSKMFVNAPPNAELVRGSSFATSEHPLLFTLAGGPKSRLCGNRSQSGRFSDDNTQQIGALEGRNGWGSALTNDWQIAQSIRISDSGFKFGRPGQPQIDDPDSRINDRRAASGAGDQVNYGIPPVWWTPGVSFNWSVSGSVSGTAYPPPRAVYNSPPDLHGRMKTLTISATGEAIVPRVAFAKPEWSSSSSPSEARESKDDPYEVRLDTRQGFGGWLVDPMTRGRWASLSPFRDNPFTPAELEPVLRPYDVDTNRLPPRLAAMLGSAAEESRLKVTTDSWDTTAITGSAAVVLFGTAAGTRSGWMQNVVSTTLYGTASPTAAVTGVIGGEVARGEKFDLNRPLVASGSTNAGYTATSEYVIQRQAYFKDLYTLLYALVQKSGSTALVESGTLAQWAANVVEFRDADSRVIPFEYDTNPQNGWAQDGNVTTSTTERGVVWGAERPEIVIREAFAWRNSLTDSAGMAIALHRPWNAKAYASGSTTFTDAETCDAALDTLLTGGTSGRPQNLVDLGKKGNAAVLASGSFSGSVYNDVSGATYPIWRLRLTAGGSTAYLRLDSGSAAANEFVLSPAITNGAGKPKLDTDSTLSLVSGTLVLTGSGVTSGTTRLEVSGSSRTVAGLQMPGPATATSGTVYLERLSDPSVAPTAAQWTADPTVGSGTTTGSVRYLVVDQTRIDVVNTATPPVAATSRKRATADPAQAFWRPPAADSLGTVQNGGTLAFPSSLAAGSTAWLPWPNRPFTSAAELLLVPQGTALEILENYRRLTPAESGTTGLGKGAPVSLALLFDAVHVPTRFAGIHTTGTADLSVHGIFSGTSRSAAATVTANQLSSWREPGRVNLNTVVAEDVWNSVVAGPLSAAVRSSAAAGLRGTPAASVGHLLALSGTATDPKPEPDTDGNVPADRNPLHGIYTATRLANTVTPRSNVFAIWITIRESVADDPDSVRYRRAFYVVDRSIPVGFEDGVDHNVWDCIRLRRIIE